MTKIIPQGRQTFSVTRWLRPDSPLHLVLGPVLWILWFMAAYAALSVGCQLLNPPPLSVFNALNISLLLLTLLVLVCLSVLAVRSWRSGKHSSSQTRAQRFTARVGFVLYVLAAVATLACALPLLVFLPCS